MGLKTPPARLLGAAVLSVMLASCQTTSTGNPSDSVHLIATSLEFVDLPEGADEILGTFEIVNASQGAICFHEDILINRLSPHVLIGDGPRGLPHQPMTFNIARIDPGERREFTRTLGYSTTSAASRREYRVSVQLWDCETQEGGRTSSSLMATP